MKFFMNGCCCVLLQYTMITLCLINGYVPFFFMLWSWLHTHIHDVCSSNFMNTDGWSWCLLCV